MPLSKEGQHKSGLLVWNWIDLLVFSLEMGKEGRRNRNETVRWLSCSCYFTAHGEPDVFMRRQGNQIITPFPDNG